MHNRNKDLKNDLNDLIIFPDQKDDTLKYYRQIIPVTIHHFYITSEVGDVDQFLELIHTLKTAESHDTIFIYLNTPGGSLKTTIQLITAMRQTNATIITCLEGEVSSAGTMIFLSGHKYLVNPNCSFMIHNYSGGILGKGQEIAAHAKFIEKYSRSLLNDIYADFLSEEEIEEVLEGRDIWLTSEQVIERLGNKVKDTSEVDVSKLVSKLPTLIEQLIRDDNEQMDKLEEELIKASTKSVKSVKPVSVKKKPVIGKKKPIKKPVK